MIATCVVIVIGFSVLLVSSFMPMRTFGGMTAVGLVLAMLCDVFILSFLLLVVLGQDEWTSICARYCCRLLASCMLTAALAAADSGRDIAQKAQAAQFTFKTLKVSGEMTLTRGSESIGQRTFSVELIEHEQAETAHDQARVTINAPTALKDTQLISWSSGSGEDQQWLVTPRTQRVQRIADRGRQAAFVSSDFSYEDILKWQVDDYDYTRVGQGAVPGRDLHVVDAKPQNRYSSYTLLKVYYDDALSDQQDRLLRQRRRTSRARRSSTAATPSRAAAGSRPAR